MRELSTLHRPPHRLPLFCREKKKDINIHIIHCIVQRKTARQYTMAIDAMEIDSNAPTGTITELPERKRKHKSQDPSTKKKRKHESSEKKPKSSKNKDKTRDSSSKPGKTPDSPYTLTTATLYLPLSPISISPTHALASLLAEHLSPSS